MLHRLMHFPVVFFGFFLFLLLLIASGDGSFTSSAAPQGAPAKHGLTGNYYVGSGGWTKDTPPATGGFLQIWTDPNDFHLPRTFTPPAATRVDAQVAFGQGKGFYVDPNVTSPPAVIWWPTGYALPSGWASYHPSTAKPWDEFAAVVWKGYIHFPKPGTYYFGTVSNGGSAVYLNQARVALNGMGGGVSVTDAFTYAKEDVQDFATKLQAPTEGDPKYQYVVPVSIDGPRNLPIEVRYSVAQAVSGHGNAGSGIDLFWVTPDSPRDANGKPIAKIVPSDALYTEAPGPIEKPVVRSANSTISADHLYFPTQNVEGAVTLTIRLADKDGNPVVGKRVSVSSVGDVGRGNWDAIVQPEKPTDEQGETAAKIRANAANPYAHDSTIFATDVSDFVDVAQVAHVTFQREGSFFFPDSFSPYYDPRIPSVEPLPLRMGQPATVKAPLVNRNKFAVELTATFEQNAWNIGASGWSEIGRVKIRLQRGEHQDATITWTPAQTTSHICFQVVVTGRMIAMGPNSTNSLTAAVLPVFIWQASGSQNASLTDSKTRNVGPVAPPTHVAPPTIPWPLGPPCKGAPRIAGGTYNESSNMIDGGVTVDEDGTRCTPSQDWKHASKNLADGYQEEWFKDCGEYINEDPDNFRREQCNSLLQLYRNALRMYHDPPDQAYQRIAVAGSDNPAEYLDAWRRSWERYQVARAEGDTEWMAKHASAIHMYVQRMSSTLRRDADQLEKQASQLAPDDANAQAQLKARQERLQNWLRKGASLTDEQRNWWHSAGLTDQDLQQIIKDLSVAPEKIQLKTHRALFLEIVSLHRKTADQIEHLDTSPTAPALAAAPGQPLTQTYAVGNPHDREETVDLFIRPISIPPDWKLSIVNAEEQKIGNENAPKYALQEIEAGKHYAVRLPGKAEIKVASVLVPTGELGAKTTAHWAVEGKIGNELIGGMVHEMNVPYIIADLKLPPVGSKEEEEELPAPSKAWPRIVTEVAAAIVILGLLTYLFIFWRKRRGAGTSSTP